MTGRSFHLHAGDTASPPYDVVVTPSSAAWTYCGLAVLTLAPGGAQTLHTGESETLVMSLEGGCSVSYGDDTLTVTGRAGVFDGPSDFVYVPREATVEISSETGGRFALPSSLCERRLPFRHQPAAAVPVELRGAGQCSRQVNNFCTPQAFEADKLIACEVLTPHGNWSSYPPHKHDQAGEHESELEEIYYFEVAAGPTGAGVGYQRVYGHENADIDVLAEVGTGDVVLIPYGWHGPSMAVPGYDLYYLNVMAGPGAERSWKICDDPAHGWVRSTWQGVDVDPRLPFAAGEVAS